MENKELLKKDKQITLLENKLNTKHVESFLIPCLDQGSIPCISTKNGIRITLRMSFFIM